MRWFEVSPPSVMTYESPVMSTDMFAPAPRCDALRPPRRVTPGNHAASTIARSSLAAYDALCIQVGSPRAIVHLLL